MKARPLNLPNVFMILLLGAGLVPSPLLAQWPAWPEKLVVDFTNAESRSISLRLGSADGITADMNFAVIDSSGRQIAEFYPHEILNDRFWSGPLDRESFTRVAIGSMVTRIELDREGALRLREEFRERIVLLREERRRMRLKLLSEEEMELQEGLNELKVQSFRMEKDLRSLEEKLKRERSLIKRDVDDLQEQIGESRDKRSDLLSDREDLLDTRDKLLRRSDPPQDRISELNAQITEIDRAITHYNVEIDDLRYEIRDLGEGSRALEDEIRKVKDKQRDLDREKRELERELERTAAEMRQLERQ